LMCPAASRRSNSHCRGEAGDGMAAPLGIQEGLVEVRTQRREHCPVTLGEVEPGPAVEVQPDLPPGPGARHGGTGQAQL
jgi:hypothetical protein